MRFQVRDLMSDVLPMETGEQTCAKNSTKTRCDPDECRAASRCQAHSGCPQASKKGARIGREMLSALREQMRQALLPA